MTKSSTSEFNKLKLKVNEDHETKDAALSGQKSVTNELPDYFDVAEKPNEQTTV